MSFFIKKIVIPVMLVTCLTFTNAICALGGNYIFSDSGEKIEIEATDAPVFDITAKSAILMEASTGTVLYEKNADEVLAPASITKIMTLILIYDAINSGKITLQDEVTTSAYAKSMGGSQVFLEEGEKQTVETLIKCIIIASGNDASVAMAEYVAGSEENFVSMMNEKAKELGMENTNFLDCCGLSDEDGHHTSARDVAIMSRYLVETYPAILQYSGVWMEDITHVTNKGTSTFTLTNTNKLLKTNEYVKGLKTGSTSKAKYCYSCFAQKDDVSLIAVVMASDNYKLRFEEANKLITYGFSNCHVYIDDEENLVKINDVVGGKENFIWGEYEQFSCLMEDEESTNSVTKKIELNKKITAPISKGDVLGKVIYKCGDNEIGSVDIIATKNLDKAGWLDYIKKVTLGYVYSLENQN